MAMGLWNSRADMEGALASQISALQKELKELRKVASKRGQQSYSDARDSASDLADEVRDAIAHAGAQFGKRARGAGETMRGHPATTAAVGLIVVGLMAALFAGRSSR